VSCLAAEHFKGCMRVAVPEIKPDVQMMMIMMMVVVVMSIG